MRKDRRFRRTEGYEGLALTIIELALYDMMTAVEKGAIVHGKVVHACKVTGQKLTKSQLEYLIEYLHGKNAMDESRPLSMAWLVASATSSMNPSVVFDMAGRVLA